ncbi:MAG: hypothetical protein EOO04_19160 [Chitinophagaceae bacterium]|nr:MAG: hypothetical protein EOO04_19160 [Chitinophagaceae bacterium]
MRYFIPSLLAMVTLVTFSCSKDKVDTKPSINVKSVSSKLVPVNGDLSVNLEFRDKEADLESIFVQKIRQNLRKTTTIRDTFSLSVADFPKKSNGELELRLFYQLQLISAERAPANPGSSTGFESDSIVIRLALRDKDKHVSDTVTTEQIVVQRIN